MKTEDNAFPDPPKIEESLLAACRASDDFRPVLFEWYKYVGIVANFVASLRRDSPAARKISELHYAVLIGLLNRVARLILANVALSHKGKFGESTAIVDRCIFESCVKLAWLCAPDTSIERFDQFIADGLKTEVEFEKEIRANVAGRGGKVLQIEKRMLASIARCFADVGITAEQAAASKKLPDVAAMIKALGQSRLLYVVGQRIGSHHVHGTWISLRIHYLEKDPNGGLRPRDHDCQTHVNQFLMIPGVVLIAMQAFVGFIFTDESVVKGFDQLLKGVGREIEKIGDQVVGTDFDLVAGGG